MTPWRDKLGFVHGPVAPEPPSRAAEFARKGSHPRVRSPLRTISAFRLHQARDVHIQPFFGMIGVFNLLFEPFHVLTK